MRGTVKPRMDARMAQDARQHGGHRAFAIGAGHMDGAIPFLRQFQTCQQFLNAFQTKFYAKDIEAF